MNFTMNELAWQKSDGLLPAIVQNAATGAVLMLGFMNEAALQQTITTKAVTFYSRSKKRLWVKGETSGNTLTLVDVLVDCDKDSLLILAHPTGPTCHQATATCFADLNQTDWDFILHLEKVIQERVASNTECSYTVSLFNSGIRKMAQKVGEEGVEVALAAVDEDETRLAEESADLFFHLLILLHSRKLNIASVIKVLIQRHYSN